MGLTLKNIRCLLKSADEDALEDVDLLIEGSKIAKIGKEIRPQGRVIDCSSSIVIPGLVNTHHHFYQTLTRNVPEVQNSSLFTWLSYLYEVWKKIDADDVYTSSLVALSELAKTGCTCTSDHHYLYPDGFDSDLTAIQFEASDRIGIRFSPARGSMSLSEKDGGLPPDSVVQSEDKILYDSERVIRKFHDPDPLSMHKIVLAPCSPFSVTPDLLRETATLARRYSVKLHTHLAETTDEEERCMSMYGMRPLDLMEECSFTGKDVYYAHGIHFNDDELKRIKDEGTGISHCPSSNMRLGSGICRVREMLDMGINVSLGVDGSASNDSSDMLGEMRQALLLQRVKYGPGALSARDVFRMATVNGSRMLGFSSGILEEGFPADLAVFDISGVEYAGSSSDMPASLIFCGISHRARYTVVNGVAAVDDYKLTGINEEELRVKADRACEKILGKKF